MQVGFKPATSTMNSVTTPFCRTLSHNEHHTFFSKSRFECTCVGEYDVISVGEYDVISVGEYDVISVGEYDVISVADAWSVPVLASVTPSVWRMHGECQLVGMGAMVCTHPC
jgi:hypothetical protein